MSNFLRLHNYSEEYLLVKEIITVAGQGVCKKDRKSKEVILENCASFTNFINEINSTKVYNAKHLDIVSPMYSSIELRRLWQYCRDAPDDGDIAGCVISEAGRVIFLKTSDENLNIIQNHYNNYNKDFSKQLIGRVIKQK